MICVFFAQALFALSFLYAFLEWLKETTTKQFTAILWFNSETETYCGNKIFALP